MPALHLPPLPGAAASARPGTLLRSLLRDDAGSWEEEAATMGPGLAASGRDDPGAHETESGSEAGAMARRNTAPPHGEAEGARAGFLRAIAVEVVGRGRA